MSNNKPTEYERCTACNARRDTEDMHECGRAKCFNYVCDGCYTGALYDREVCSDDGAELAAHELTAAVRAQHQARRATESRLFIDTLLARWAAAPAPVARVIEYTDNRWLGIADGPVTVRKVAA